MKGPQITPGYREANTSLLTPLAQQAAPVRAERLRKPKQRRRGPQKFNFGRV